MTKTVLDQNIEALARVKAWPERAKAWKEKTGKRQVDLAHASGVHKYQLSAYLNGHIVPNSDKIARIEAVFLKAGV